MSDSLQGPADSPARFSLDLISSYLAALVRVLAWVVITAAAFRAGGEALVGLIIAARAWAQLAMYLPPALNVAALRVLSVPQAVEAHQPSPEATLDYEARRAVVQTSHPLAGVFRARVRITLYAATVAVLFAIGAVLAIPTFFNADVVIALALFTAGSLIRLQGEVASAALQARGRLALDNAFNLLAELIWIGFVLALAGEPTIFVAGVALMYALCQFLLTGTRQVAMYILVEGSLRAMLFRERRSTGPTRETIRDVWRIYVASLADFLYAPAGLILASWVLGEAAAGEYGIVLQVDAAMLLLVAGISSTLMPRFVRAWNAGDRSTFFALYVRWSIFSIGLLGLAGVVILGGSDWILTIWLGRAPDRVIQLLPWVLVHTVIGGAAGVGRAALLASGKSAAWARSAWAFGLANLLLALGLTTLADLGLMGIVLATVLTVCLRCAVWLPWTVHRSVRSHH
jgi:O-antigen/teichoic acid export membrane protein